MCLLCKRFYSSFDQNLDSFERFRFVSISNQFDIDSFIIEDIYNLCPILAYIYFAGMQKKTDSGLDAWMQERKIPERRDAGKEGC